MQEIVTASPAGSSFFSSTSQEILSPLANQAKTSITLDWSQTREHSIRGQDRRQNQESLTPPHQSSNRVTRKSLSPSFMNQRGSPGDNQKLAAERTVIGQNTNNRWRFNNAGQLVDSDISPAEWDLADEIMRLKIGSGDGSHSQAHTPPQGKMGGSAMGQYHEGSSLDTSSQASIDSSSPHSSDKHLNLASHSRGSSTDTSGSGSQSSVRSTAGHNLHVAALAPPKVNTRERPHSYSGGLSAAELQRLQHASASPVQTGSPGELAGQQQQQWQAASGKGNQAESPMYPSVAAFPTLLRSQQQSAGPSAQDYNRQEEPEYNMQRNPGLSRQQPQQQFQGRGPIRAPANVSNQVPNYSQPQPPQSAFAPQLQGLLPSPTSFAYPAPQPSQLPFSAQQMYEMMLQNSEPHPAVARVQQQHGVARQAHQHSASDPGATLRDPAALALLQNMQAFAGAGGPAPGMYPPAMAGANPALQAMYANQFFPRQDMYPPAAPDLVTAQALAAAQLQAQYTGAYPGVLSQGLPVGAAAVNLTGGSGVGSDSGTTTASNANGPSANNRKLGLYKTELCRSWEEKGTCRYGTKCQFAHGEDEVRKVPRHPKYKTEICRTFWVSGSCPYGKRCCFIHTELPTGAPTPEGPPPPANGGGRDRSNSDPNDASTSLLVRISARRSQEDAIATPTSAMPSGRPPLGSLKLDISSLGASVAKENKSAYPTFPTNGGSGLMHTNTQVSAMSPGPVTAGPDFGGRHNGRSELPQPRLPKNTSIDPNVRHSFNGTEVALDFNSPQPATSHPSSLGMSNTINSLATPRASGHMRSGSAGNWSSLSRSSHLAPAYPGSPNVEMKAGGHWEVPVGGSRLSEKSWI